MLWCEDRGPKKNGIYSNLCYFQILWNLFKRRRDYKLGFEIFIELEMEVIM